MNILVTGGAGFIGSHVVDRLIQDGHAVTVVDDLSTGKRDYVNPKAAFYQIDLLDPALESVVRRHAVTVVCHHAAQAAVRVSLRDPLADARVNVLGSLAVFETCRKVGAARVIFASSGGAIYGEAETVPTPEGAPLRPLSPYGVSKLAVEQYLQAYQAVSGLPSLTLRYANVYGPRQDPMGEAGVIAIFLHRLLAGESPTINGDGRQTRDFIFVSDVVDATALALTSDYHGVLNIGTGQETSVLALWETLRGLVQAALPPHFGPAIPGELKRSCLEPSLAWETLGWRPQIPLSVGLQKTLAAWVGATGWGR